MSLNIESIKNNSSPLISHLPNCDIVCLQEHWLYDYQKDYIREITDSHDYAICCSDMNEPITPLLRRRGYGGIVTLWNKNLSHLVKELPEKSERVQATMITTRPPNKNLCIINTYMPCSSTPDCKFKYQDVLDQISEIITKYEGSCNIILCGDMNVSLVEPKYTLDRFAIQYMEQHSLMPSSNYPRKNTFVHRHGSGGRQIDYILSNTDIVHDIKICDHEGENTSTHVPVLATVEFVNPDSIVKVENSKPRTNSTFRYKWDKCDVSKYKDTLLSYIPRTLKIEPNPPSIEAAITTITHCLHKASQISVPISKSKPRRLNIPWNEDIATAAQNSREAHYNWKQAGRPVAPDNTFTTRKNAKSVLRRTIRSHHRAAENKLYEQLMDTHSNKDALFYKLIKKQRSTAQNHGHVLKENGELVTDINRVLDIWASHYQYLGTPLSNPNFNEKYKKQVELDIIAIETLLSKTKVECTPVTLDEVNNAVKRLNKNKAMDSVKITAEHLKLAGPILLPHLADLLTAILICKYVPNLFKEGILATIHKKGKDPLDKDNFRGIVLSAILAKLCEHVIQAREKPITDPQQCELQFGFSHGKSPSMAALVVTEVIADRADMGKPTYMASLDVQKAFDVVWHESLFRKLFMSGICDTWELHTSLLKGIHVRIRLCDLLSSEVCVNQGVGQGRILGPANYKVYVNPVLKMLRDAGLGARIGSIYCGCPACADDIIFSCRLRQFSF